MRTKVLFLCAGNSDRSQMAQALLRQLAGDDFEAFSAGLKPGGIHPLTVRVMEEIGCSLAGQRSKGLEEYLGREHFHFLITVCAEAESGSPRLWPGVDRRMFWSFDDPAAWTGSEDEKLAQFRRVRDRIQARLRCWLDEIDWPGEPAPVGLQKSNDRSPGSGAFLTNL